MGVFRKFGNVFEKIHSIFIKFSESVLEGCQNLICSTKQPNFSESFSQIHQMSRVLLILAPSTKEQKYLNKPTFRPRCGPVKSAMTRILDFFSPHSKALPQKVLRDVHKPHICGQQQNPLGLHNQLKFFSFLVNQERMKYLNLKYLFYGGSLNSYPTFSSPNKPGGAVQTAFQYHHWVKVVVM